MEKNEVYFFHQTPEPLCKELIKHIDLIEGDRVLEPFRGEGAFYNSFPDYVIKDWTEIMEGKNYLDYTGEIDWVISNPPFRLDNGVKQVNVFFQLIKYYTSRVNKGIAFLANDSCFSTLTPKRMEEINQLGWYINKIVVCNIKKWRGRYFFIIFNKTPSNFYNYVMGSF